MGFQGERGAYSEDAVVRHFGADGVEPVACQAFEDVFAAVAAGVCRYGMVPIENSVAGSNYPVYDLLLAHDLHIVGEQYLRIDHYLIAAPGVKLQDLRHVYGHPQALAQCRETLGWLPGVQRHAAYDNAGSVAMIQREGLTDAAAVASARAAEVYSMSILKTSIADNPENYTRFLALAREPEPFQGEAKTSIVFAARRNVPGALFRALSCFALRDIDLTKIQSRPQKGKPWAYLFYLDFLGKVGESPTSNALGHLEEIASFVKVLGCYERGDMERA